MHYLLQCFIVSFLRVGLRTTTVFESFVGPYHFPV